MLLSSVLTVPLLGVAAIHALWGLGIWFPIKDEEALARAVVGARGVTRMPGPIPCFLVVGALVFLTIILWAPDVLAIQLIIALAALVFLGRGVLVFTRIWRRMTPEQPFATLDTRYYGPLCLLIGALLVLRLIMG